MDNYLLPEDDGLRARSFGPWVAVKLDYLKRYIDVFETSMRNRPWRQRTYIDLFAGSGKCYVKTQNKFYLGSPLLALSTQYPFTHYYFVDIDEANITALQQRCGNPKNITYKVGDSNQKVFDILADIKKVDNQFIKGIYSSLNLAFLDPDGLELEWRTVEALAQADKMDLIIHYSQFGLTRNIEGFYKSNEETVIDRFFGDQEWRKVYRDYLHNRSQGGIHRQLIDYYKSKLQTLGYVDVLRDDETGAEPLIRNAKRKAPLYRLIFASKHQLGHDFWKAVTRKDVYGQERLC